MSWILSWKLKRQLKKEILKCFLEESLRYLGFHMPGLESGEFWGGSWIWRRHNLVFTKIVQFNETKKNDDCRSRCADSRDRFLCRSCVCVRRLRFFVAHVRIVLCFHCFSFIILRFSSFLCLCLFLFSLNVSFLFLFFLQFKFSFHFRTSYFHCLLTVFSFSKLLVCPVWLFTDFVLSPSYLWS